METSVAQSRRPDWRTVVVWAVAAPWLVWALVRGFGLEFGYPLVPLMAYTPYVAAASIVPLAVALILRNWVAVELMLIAMLVLVSAVLPRMAGGAEPAGPAALELRVVSANIYRGRADMDELMNIVRETDADLLSIQEVTPEAVAALDRLGLRELLPYRTQKFSGEYLGSGIYSRFPTRDLTPIRTPPAVKATGKLLAMPRAMVYVPGGSRADVVAAHPYPPLRGRVDDWQTALDSLPESGDGPLRLLIGDFNATLDHDSFQALLERGYKDAGDTMGEGLTPTWRVGGITPPPITIDHIVVDERAEIGAYEVHDLAGSDHEALSATVFLPMLPRVRRPGDGSKGG